MTRKGAGIYEFHGESEFEIEGLKVVDFLSFEFFAEKNPLEIC